MSSVNKINDAMILKAVEKVSEKMHKITCNKLSTRKSKKEYRTKDCSYDKMIKNIIVVKTS